VQEKAAEELLCRQRHQAFYVSMRPVSPAECDISILERDQAIVGNGHSMGVAAEIAENIFRAAEGRLAMDDPVLAVEFADEGTKSLRVGKVLQFPVKADLAFGETSPLYQKLVLNEQKADFITADYSPHMGPHLFTIYARLKTANDIPAVEQDITQTLEVMKEKTVDEKRLNDLKSNRKYSFLMSFDTSKSITSGFYRSSAPYISLIRGVKGVDELFETYQSITPQDIQKAAQQYFQKEKRTRVGRTMSSVGPLRDQGGGFRASPAPARAACSRG